MPIFSRNPLMLAGEDIKPESTSGEVFGALFSEAMDSGLLGSLSRTEQLDQTEFGGTMSQYGSAAASREAVGQRPRRLSQTLSPEQARQRLRDNGLEQNLSVSQQGIREETLDILMGRKREELRRQMILSQSSGGTGVFAGLAGSLVGSLVDPTNIALAFVPVVGQARYAAWLGKAGGTLGRTGVRVGVGATEGLVGLAPVEALNYYSRQREQADYDAYDSMVAIAGGAFFGSALHAGAGLLGDALRPTRWAAGPEVAPRAETGAPGRVETPIPVPDAAARERMMVMERLAEGRPVTQRQVEALRPRTGADAGQVIDNRLAELQRVATDGLLDEAKVRALVKEQGELEALVRTQDRPGVLLAPENRLTPEERALADTRRQEVKLELEKHKQAQAAGKELGDLQAKLERIDSDPDLIRLADKLMPLGADARFVDGLSPEVRAQLDADPFMPIRPFVASLEPETQAAALRMAITQAVSGRPIDVAPAVLSDGRYFDPESAFASANRNAGEVDGANPAMADWAATVKPLPDDVESAVKIVSDTEEDVLARLKAAGRELTESDREALDGLAAEAKAQSEAAKVAAMCMMRTGG